MAEVITVAGEGATTDVDVAVLGVGEDASDVVLRMTMKKGLRMR